MSARLDTGASLRRIPARRNYRLWPSHSNGHRTADTGARRARLGWQGPPWPLHSASDSSIRGTVLQESSPLDAASELRRPPSQGLSGKAVTAARTLGLSLMDQMRAVAHAVGPPASTNGGNSTPHPTSSTQAAPPGALTSEVQGVPTYVMLPLDTVRLPPPPSPPLHHRPRCTRRPAGPPARTTRSASPPNDRCWCRCSKLAAPAAACR
jgi:hypothetical protein